MEANKQCKNISGSGLGMASGLYEAPYCGVEMYMFK